VLLVDLVVELAYCEWDGALDANSAVLQALMMAPSVVVVREEDQVLLAAVAAIALRSWVVG
jgi:hypothetical protein